MSNQEQAENIYPTRSPPVSPTISPPGFNTFDLSRANSLARLGSELHTLAPPPLPSSLSFSHNPHTPHTPYPPATPSATQSPVSARRGVPPPIITNFTASSHTPLATPVNAFVTAGNITPRTTNNGNNVLNHVASSTKVVDLREMSVTRWRTGHAFVIFGALLMMLGFCIGLMHSPVTTCKVPYMSYSYYDNYVPFANMECKTHATGWYAGAPLLAIGALCAGFSWYYSWVKVQEMKMASKYHVAMV